MSKPEIIWHRGERWILKDDGSAYVRLAELAPRLEWRWRLEHPEEVKRHANDLAVDNQFAPER